MGVCIGDTGPPLAAKPRVRVLMATYNGGIWLDQQLESIFAQRGIDLTVLVADDRSSDGTLHKLQLWKDKGFPVDLVAPAENRLGAAGTFFRLIAAVPLAGIDAVALADQDDIWSAGRLARALEILASTGAAGYSSDVVAFWPNGRERQLGKAYPQRLWDHLFEPAGPGCTYVLTAKFVRMVQIELAASAGQLAEVGYHDWWLYAYARTHGLSWYIDPEATVRYRQHAHNELGANFGLYGTLKRLERLCSGWQRHQTLTMAHAWPGPHEELVARLRRLNWRDRSWLAMRTSEMRRRPRDQLALAIFIMSGILR